MLAKSQINSPESFNARIDRLSHAHAVMARAARAKASRSGLIVFRPKWRQPALPLRLSILPIVALFGFKALMLMQIGEISYRRHIDALASASGIERIGAWVMQVDPVTRILAKHLTAMF